jgi:hypothetical protein
MISIATLISEIIMQHSIPSAIRTASTQTSSFSWHFQQIHQYGGQFWRALCRSAERKGRFVPYY